MIKLFIAIIFNAIILWALNYFLSWDVENPSIIVQGGITTYLIAGTVLGAINLTIKPILKILSLPFFFLFYGLVVIIINGIVLYLLDFIINTQLAIDGFVYKIAGKEFSMDWWINFIIAVAIFSVFNMMYALFFKK